MPSDGELALPSYSDRVRRLLRRWDPRGLLVTRSQAMAAVARLDAPPDLSTAKELEHARWVCDAAVHPVLKEAVPSAFRVCAFLPVTYGLSVAMISSARLYASTLAFHWLYQTHSAATRYCNYADTSRPLSVERMGGAYAASTAAAWGVALGSAALVNRLPRLRLLGMVVPHGAVACAGAVSTVMNAETELREGVAVVDASGKVAGVSRAAALATVQSAVLLHGVLVPGCALLLPVVTTHAVLSPWLMRTGRARFVWPASAALVAGCCAVVTPLVAALVPPIVALPPEKPLEPEVRRPTDAAGRPAMLFSSRPLY